MGGMGREAQDRAICIPMADSCWGLTENNKLKVIILQLINQCIKKENIDVIAEQTNLLYYNFPDFRVNLFYFH